VINENYEIKLSDLLKLKDLPACYSDIERLTADLKLVDTVEFISNDFIKVNINANIRVFSLLNVSYSLKLEELVSILQIEGKPSRIYKVSLFWNIVVYNETTANEIEERLKTTLLENNKIKYDIMYKDDIVESLQKTILNHLYNKETMELKGLSTQTNNSNNNHHINSANNYSNSNNNNCKKSDQLSWRKKSNDLGSDEYILLLLLLFNNKTAEESFLKTRITPNLTIVTLKSLNERDSIQMEIIKLKVFKGIPITKKIKSRKFKLTYLL